MDTDLGYEVFINQPYEQALETVAAALKTEGFGVLTKIDVRAVMKEKLGVEFRPYAILGACNPVLSHRALTSDPAVGLLLPCNVTVEEAAGGRSLVRIVNPQTMMEVGELGENPQVKAVAQEAGEKLARVKAALGAA